MKISTPPLAALQRAADECLILSVRTDVPPWRARCALKMASEMLNVCADMLAAQSEVITELSKGIE